MMEMSTLATFGLVLLVGYWAWHIIYNIYLHPLANYPGPFLHKITDLPSFYYSIIGKGPYHIADLHKKYGPIVRINTYSLSYTDPDAWKDIMGHRSAGLPEMGKFARFYNPDSNNPMSIVNAPAPQHGALRKCLSHAFSEKSLRGQEPIMMKYVDMLVHQLEEQSQGGKVAMDMNRWYNYYTFDVIGDLSFGAPFGYIEKPNDDFMGWLVTSSSRAAVMFAANHYPYLGRAVQWYIEKFSGHLDVMTQSAIRLSRRITSGEKRPDFLQPLLDNKAKLNLTGIDLFANTSVLVTAGSETTGTLLIGLTWMLLKNPETLKKLNEEVRARYTSESDIDFATINELPYLNACLDEGMRMYPPSPSSLPRVVPVGGAEICGKYVPEHTVVQIFQYAMHRDERNFTAPDEFRPERWLKDPAFASDELKASQPFHLGPRGCVGKHLARMEMGAMLSRMIYKFDMELDQPYDNWMDQKVWDIWSRGSLKVRLTPAAH